MATTALKAETSGATLTVNDVTKSLKFYRDGLGFAVQQEWKSDDGVLQGLMLEAGSASLGISQDDFAKGRDRVKGVAMRFYLETKQDIEALAAQAKSNGITLNEGPGPMPWGPVGFTVTDPDGFKWTITSPSQM